GAVALAVRDLTVLGERGTAVLDGLNLTVRAGEIVGLAGVEGNGQTELARAVLGTVRPDGGTVELGGVPVTSWDPYRRIVAGLGYIPEDRGRDGLAADFTVAENLVLNQYRDAPLSHRGVLD
ncbi:ATP-binding cassette domain-containing protein, partial [Streptomyces californicus]